MNNRLEQFVRDHREEFDTGEPDNKIWEETSREMDPGKKKQTPVVQIQIRWIKWSAAAVLLLIAGAIWFFRTGKDTQQPGLVHQANTNNQKNPNREQLLEAMLQNLHMQMELLNHQLENIKQINHSKKSEYEKAYKTV